MLNSVDLLKLLYDEGHKMPRFDRCHDQVMRALQKDGWQITNMNLRLFTEDRSIFVDIQAQQSENGSRQQILLAEVKCFSNRDSTTRDLYEAIGQYLIYQAVLDTLQDATPLFLAVPEDIFSIVFDSAVQKVITHNKIKLVIVNLETETIQQWRR